MQNSVSDVLLGNETDLATENFRGDADDLEEDADDEEKEDCRAIEARLLEILEEETGGNDMAGVADVSCVTSAGRR